MRFVTLVKLVIAACVAFAIALVAVVKTIDIQQYRLLVTDLLHAATGRNVAVNGDFQLALSLTPRIVATDVAMANQPGTRRSELLKIARVEAEIGLLALLRREVEIRNLTLVAPDLALEIDESGRGNWHLTSAGAASRLRGTAGAPMTALRIHAVTVEGGRLELQDRSARTVSVLSLSHVAIVAADADTPIAVTAKGQFGKLPLDLAGTLGSFAQLAGGKPFPVTLQASAGGNQAVVDGSLAATGPHLKVSLQGNDVAEAAAVLGYAVPALGPFRASFRLTGSWEAPELPELEAGVGRKELLRLTAKGSIAQPRRHRGVQLAVNAEVEAPDKLGKLLGWELPLKAPLKASGKLADGGEGWRINEVKAMVGRSDLAGDVAISDGPQPLVAARLASKQADLADFGFKPVLPVPKASGDPLFRDEALLPLSGITAFDLDITWHADKVTADGVTLAANPGEATLLLRGGVLMMRPFTTALSGIISVPSPH